MLSSFQSLVSKWNVSSLNKTFNIEQYETKMIKSSFLFGTKYSPIFQETSLEPKFMGDHPFPYPMF